MNKRMKALGAVAASVLGVVTAACGGGSANNVTQADMEKWMQEFSASPQILALENLPPPEELTAEDCPDAIQTLKDARDNAPMPPYASGDFKEIFVKMVQTYEAICADPDSLSNISKALEKGSQTISAAEDWQNKVEEKFPGLDLNKLGTPEESTEGTPAPEQPAQKLSFGESATTDGAPESLEGTGGGVLKITPVTVAYIPSLPDTDVPQNDLFVVVAFTEAPQTAAPATETGEWQWQAGGQTLEAGNRSASYVTPYSGAKLGGVLMEEGPVQPGDTVWSYAAFDIKDSQRGGSLVYTDGGGTEYRWDIPAQDSGPHLNDLKTAFTGQ